MDKTIEINSFQDFVTAIEKLDNNYYFRGESSLSYKKILASAFRFHRPLFSDANKVFDYQTALKDYYTEIAHELSEIERDNFLHYAQHHGLPTPLIDITSNPLTALYFACSSNFSKNSCRVYAFNQNKFIDLSDFEMKNNIKFNNLYFDHEFTRQVLIKIKDLSEEIKQQLLFDCVQNLKHLIDKKSFLTDSKYIGKEETATLTEILRKQFSHNENDEDNNSFCERFKNLFLTYFEIDFRRDSDKKQYRTKLSYKEGQWFFKVHYEEHLRDELAVIILFLIIQQSKNMMDDFHARKVPIETYLASDDNRGVVFPPIVVHPSVKFERMKSQEGTFLYQVPHFRGKTNEYLGFSNINGDIEFIINNKKDIFLTLNKLGINRKTIFPDHDNVAGFLKNSQLLE